MSGLNTILFGCLLGVLLSPFYTNKEDSDNTIRFKSVVVGVLLSILFTLLDLYNKIPQNIPTNKDYCGNSSTFIPLNGEEIMSSMAGSDAFPKD